MVLNYMQVIAIIFFHAHSIGLGIILGILIERTKK